MLWRRLLIVIILGATVAAPPISHASAATPCNWAQFISDVSVPDGSVFSPGTIFTKTWRLQNIGTCTWTTGYSLVFDSGSQMSGPASVSLTSTVAHGQNVDLSVMLTAPAAPGRYRGFWKLKDASGTSFGIGASATGAFWVDIEVQDSAAVAYDLVTYAPYAQWSSGAGPLPFPGTSGDSRGYALRLDSLTMEDGAFTTRPSLLTFPQNRFDGYIQAVYPEYTVQSGDRFQAAVGCEAGSSCYVNFRLNYVTVSGSTRSFWSRQEMNDGRVYQASVDLSALAGQTVRFELALLALGSPSGDRAIWGAPRIVRAAGSPNPSTAVPPPTFTPSATPFGAPPVINPSACDRAAFVADINVPDGAYFAPGAAFSKTWRLKNSGSCAWTTDYRLLFYTGAQMSGPTTLNLPRNVAPGETIDLTVNLITPPANGEYIGYWVLSNPAGALFALGSDGKMPFWVRINVAGEAAFGSGYDFAANACAAQWRSGAGALPCPGTEGDAAGFVIPQAAPHLEDGSTGTLPGLLTVPQNKFDGYIQGIYPAFTVQPGDRFQTTAGCEFQAPCYVTFRLDYMSPSGEIHNFWSRAEQNEGQFHYVDVDLTPLAGQSVRFTLSLLATGSAAGDRAMWGAPHIFRPASPLTATPSPTATPSDWLTYTSTKYGFEFRYPKGSQIESQNENYAKIQLPFTPGTSLLHKYMELTIADPFDTCRNPLGLGGVQFSGTVTINGITYLKEGATEGAAGNKYEWVGYSTTRGTTCVSMGFVLHSMDPSSFPTPVPPFDKAAESAVFEQIVSTFTWLGPTPTPTATQTPIGGDWLTYTNAKYGFQLRYPPQGQMTSQTDNYAKISLPFTPGTNLREKYLEVQVTENLNPCRTSLVGIVTASETVVINGISFLKETGMDGAAGNFYDWVAYSTLRGSTCISLGFMLHSLDPGALPTEVPQFDKAAESAVFGQIVNTFTWLTPTDTPTPTSTFTPTPTLVSGDWLTYTNARYGFQLKYPREGQIGNQLDNYAKIQLPIQAGTNLKEKYLEIYVAENIDPCQSPLATTSMLQSSETVVINGITYLKQIGGDGATSNIYQWVAYSTARGAACVSLNFVLHSINPGVYETPPPVFNETLEKAVFEQIVSTFAWLTPTDTPTPTTTHSATPTPTGTPPPGPLPDLTVLGMSIGYQNPGCLMPGDPFGLWVRVSNIGQAAATAFMVQVGDAQSPVDGLGAGESVSVLMNAATMGGQLTALVDSASQIAESDETNNSLTQYVPVPTQPLPCTPTPAALSGPYAVIMVNQGGALNVYSDAGAANLVVGSLAWNASGIMGTGATKFADGSEWIQVIRTDGGTGWVDSSYLTEQVSSAAFCGDGGISGMIGQIKQAVDWSDGSTFGSLVSPRHGVRVGYWQHQTVITYAQPNAAGIFKDPTEVNWGAGPSSIPDVGTFAAVVQPDMAEVLDSSYQTACDDPSYASMFPNAWPYPNVHYYAVVKPPTNTFDWKVWLFGFEYVDGRPFLYGTVHFVWDT